MSTYVVDASVAAAWLLPDEPLLAQAAATRDSYLSGQLKLLAPDLLYPETGNVLWKAVRRGRITARIAHEAAAALIEMEIPTSSAKPLLPQALVLANDTGRSVYDSVYVALALSSGHPLLTADERLANALSPRLPVHWLGLI